MFPEVIGAVLLWWLESLLINLLQTTTDWLLSLMPSNVPAAMIISNESFSNGCIEIIGKNAFVISVSVTVG